MHRFQLFFQFAVRFIRIKLAFQQHTHILEEFFQFSHILQNILPLLFPKSNDRNDAYHCLILKDGISQIGKLFAVCPFLTTYTVGVVVHIPNNTALPSLKNLLKKIGMGNGITDFIEIIPCACHTNQFMVYNGNICFQNRSDGMYICLNKRLYFHQRCQACHLPAVLISFQHCFYQSIFI